LEEYLTEISLAIVVEEWVHGVWRKLSDMMFILKNRELEELSKGENIAKWIKGQRIRWLGHLERMEEDRMPKTIFTGKDETKRKNQERMERRSRKRSSSAGSEKMERVGDREKWRGIFREAKAHSGL
jgi:hypothetical protein